VWASGLCALEKISGAGNFERVQTHCGCPQKSSGVQCLLGTGCLRFRFRPGSPRAAAHMWGKGARILTEINRLPQSTPFLADNIAWPNHVRQRRLPGVWAGPDGWIAPPALLPHRFRRGRGWERRRKAGREGIGNRRDAWVDGMVGLGGTVKAAAGPSIFFGRSVQRWLGWRLAFPGPNTRTRGTHFSWLGWCAKGKRRSFDYGRFAAFAQDDSAWLGFVLSQVSEARPGATIVCSTADGGRWS